METKSAVGSSGMWGGAIAAVASLLMLFNINIMDLVPDITDVAAQGYDWVMKGIALGGAILGLIGRWRASSKIVSVLPK